MKRERMDIIAGNREEEEERGNEKRAVTKEQVDDDIDNEKRLFCRLPARDEREEAAGTTR